MLSLSKPDELNLIKHKTSTDADLQRNLCAYGGCLFCRFHVSCAISHSLYLCLPLLALCTVPVCSFPFASQSLQIRGRDFQFLCLAAFCISITAVFPSAILLLLCQLQVCLYEHKCLTHSETWICDPEKRFIKNIWSSIYKTIWNFEDNFNLLTLS